MEGKLLQDIVKRVLAVSNPDRIILFGSQATGQAARDSDIDLLILQREVENAHDASVSIRAALNGMGKAFDVIVMRTERFEETKNVIGGIAYPANKYGKVVYEAA